MNLPNILTLFRIALTFVFIIFLNEETYNSIVISFLIFGIASLTDWLDGYIARKYNLITPFGKIMDPIADKFLTLSAFYLFAQMSIFPFWMFYVIAFREIFITVLRFKAAKKGKVLAAEKAGKLKTVLQMGTIVFILLFLMLATQEFFISSGIDYLLMIASQISFILMIGVTVMTLYSGLTFLANNRNLLYAR